MTMQAMNMGAIPLAPQTRKSKEVLVNEYLKDSGGVFRCLQAIEKALKFAATTIFAQVRETTGTYPGEDLAKRAGVAWNLMGVPRIPGLVSDFRKKVQVCQAASGSRQEWAQRKTREAFRTGSELAAMTFYGASALTGNSTLAKIGSFPDMASNLTEASLLAQDLLCAQEASKLAESGNLSPEIKRALADSKKAYLLKLAKVCCSIFTGVVAMATLFGVSLGVSAMTMATMSLAGTALAIIAHFYEQKCPYKTVDCFSIAHAPLSLA